MELLISVIAGAGFVLVLSLVKYFVASVSQAWIKSATDVPFKFYISCNLLDIAQNISRCPFTFDIFSNSLLSNFHFPSKASK